MSSRGWWPLFAAQTLSMGGRGLSAFALGVWVFDRTQSATWFALLSIASTVPGILLGPVVGVWADRVGPRRGLVAAEAVGLISGLALVVLFALGLATPLRLLALLAVANVGTSVHWPAWTAATTTMVVRERLAKASALMQLGHGARLVIAPALAGAVLVALGVHGVVAMDAATFALGLVTAWWLVPRRQRDPERQPLRKALSGAMATVRGAGLLPLCGYVLLTYLPGSFVVALSTPLVLSLAGPEALGWVLAAQGMGMVVGSVVASRWARASGGVGRLLRYDLLLAASMIVTPLLAGPGTLALAGFSFTFGLAGLMAEEQAQWQVRVPVAQQARAMGLRKLFTWSALPVGYGLAGLLADHLFEPGMRVGGALAGTLGPFLGVGPGRGYALLIAVAGLGKLAVVVSGALHRGLLQLDEDASEVARVPA